MRSQRPGRTKASSRILLVLSVARGRSRKAVKAGVTLKTMPEATKEATLPAKCGATRTIVSLH